jgi:DNA repair exonuclease SbcCD ATPase subunit
MKFGPSHSLSCLFFILPRNIQVENPVAVLDQEEAKKFLTGKAEDKYNFFMKATDLERVDRTYAQTVDHVQDLRDSQEKIKDTLQINYDQVAELKKKWDAHQALDKMEDKVSELKVKLAWALFTTVDNECTLSLDVSTYSESNLMISSMHLKLTFLSRYFSLTGHDRVPRKSGEISATTLAGRRGCECAH